MRLLLQNKGSLSFLLSNNDQRKGSDGMLIIQQVSEKSTVISDYVRCPSCKTGRLCDKPAGTRIRAVPLDDTLIDGTGIILKCPKCAKKFTLQFHIKK